MALLTWQSDTFAYAESYDEAAARYRGLRGGQAVSLSADSAGLLVKPDVARRQMDAEAPSADRAPVEDRPGGSWCQVAYDVFWRCRSRDVLGSLLRPIVFDDSTAPCNSIPPASAATQAASPTR